ncbi:MAG: TonB-dependent receptor [Mariniflexile sp.]|jgi:TonB-dependent receptor
MNYKIIFGFLIFMITHLSFGQQTLGKVKGTVIDSSTKESIGFATVSVKGEMKGVVADIDGNFEIELPMGTYIFICSSVGYEKTEIQVSVIPNEPSLIEIELNPGNTLNEIVISVQAKGQITAIHEQLASNKIVNVISSEKMLELPDANAAEAIGRLPGISLQRSSGEASKVVIRGVAPAQNNVTIAGVKMASTNAGDRSADLSIVQSEMLSGVEISKTLRADMDAGATGGTVDLKLAKARKKPSFNAMSEGGYNNLFSNVGDSKTSVGGSTRFLKNKFGIKIQGTYEQKQLSSQRFGGNYTGPILKQELDPEGNLTGEESYIARTTGANLNLVNTIRERMGLSMVLDFKSEFYDVAFLNLVNKSSNDFTNRGESFDFTSATRPFFLGVSVGNDEILNTTHILENKLRLLGTELDLSMAYTHVKTEAHNNYYPFREFSKTTEFIDTDMLVFRRPEELLELRGAPNVDDNKLQSSDINDSDLKDNNYDINIKWHIPFELKNLNTKGILSLGGNYHLLERSSNSDAVYMDYMAGRGNASRNALQSIYPDLVWPAGDQNGIAATNFVDPNYNPGEFLNGRYNLSWSPDINILEDMTSQSRTNFPDLFYQRGNQSYSNDYNTREEQIATFAMLELTIGKLLLVPGIRMEKVDTQYDAFQLLLNAVNSNGLQGIPDSVSVKRNNKIFFPSINAKYKFNESVALRGAIYKSVSRPGFIQLSPRTVVDVNRGNLNFSSTNPFLEPSTAWNYDLSLEIYNRTFGLLTINPFYKQIDDFISFLPDYFPLRNDRIREAPEGFVESLPGLDFYPVDDLINSHRTRIPINNPEKAEYYGVEFSYQKNFRALENKILKGLVLDVNVTLIDSKAKYPYFENIVVGIDSTGFFPQPIPGYKYSTREGKMVGQPSFISNVILGWDYKGFSSRVSYRFQGKTLSGLDAKYSFADAYTDKFQLLDISLKQRIFESFHIYLNATNLTNHIDENYSMYQENRRLPVSNQYYGSRVIFGAMYRF